MKTIVGLPIETTHELSEDLQYWVMKPEYAIPYRASIEAQTKSWLEGKPIHNTFSDECCPDFSCCSPENLWPEEKRKQFQAASEDDRILMMFGQLRGLSNKKVYISDFSAGEIKH